jgi:hypothetical protein
MRVNDLAIQGSVFIDRGDFFQDSSAQRSAPTDVV